jgi:hypothetical protein
MSTGSTSVNVTNNATTRPNWRYNGKWQAAASGTFNGTSFTSQGVDNTYWSGYGSNTQNASPLRILFYTLLVANGGAVKIDGYAVRCMQS